MRVTKQELGLITGADDVQGLREVNVGLRGSSIPCL
jgi:hypothetical protein